MEGAVFHLQTHVTMLRLRTFRAARRAPLAAVRHLFRPTCPAPPCQHLSQRLGQPQTQRSCPPTCPALPSQHPSQHLSLPLTQRTCQQTRPALQCLRLYQRLCQRLSLRRVQLQFHLDLRLGSLPIVAARRAPRRSGILQLSTLPTLLRTTPVDLALLGWHQMEGAVFPLQTRVIMLRLRTFRAARRAPLAAVRHLFQPTCPAPPCQQFPKRCIVAPVKPALSRYGILPQLLWTTKRHTPVELESPILSTRFHMMKTQHASQLARQTMQRDNLVRHATVRPCQCWMTLILPC